MILLALDWEEQIIKAFKEVITADE